MSQDTLPLDAEMVEDINQGIHFILETSGFSSAKFDINIVPIYGKKIGLHIHRHQTEISGIAKQIEGAIYGAALAEHAKSLKGMPQLPTSNTPFEAGGDNNPIVFASLEDIQLGVSALVKSIDLRRKMDTANSSSIKVSEPNDGERQL